MLVAAPPCISLYRKAPPFMCAQSHVKLQTLSFCTKLSRHKPRKMLIFSTGGGSAMFKRLCTAAGLVMFSGLVLMSTGCKKQPLITLACNASAPSVYPGDQLTVTASPGSVSTKKNNSVLY